MILILIFQHHRITSSLIQIDRHIQGSINTMQYMILRTRVSSFKIFQLLIIRIKFTPLPEILSLFSEDVFLPLEIWIDLNAFLVLLGQQK